MKPLTPAEKARQIEALERAIWIIKMMPAPKCPACDHFGPDGVCGVWKQAVPASHLESGCDQFSDAVPF